MDLYLIVTSGVFTYSSMNLIDRPSADIEGDTAYKTLDEALEVAEDIFCDIFYKEWKYREMLAEFRKNLSYISKDRTFKIEIKKITI